MKFLAILGLAVIAVNSTNIARLDVGKPECEHSGKGDERKEDYKSDGKREQDIDSHRDNRS